MHEIRLKQLKQEKQNKSFEDVIERVSVCEIRNESDGNE